MGSQADQTPPLDFHIALGGMIDAADQVEDRRLPRSVGPDQADQLSPLEFEVEIRDGLQPSKKMGQPADLKERHEFPPWT